MATVGRKKRKRKPGSRTGVTVKGHVRSPRGPDRGKKPVRVDGYARGKPTGAQTGNTGKHRRHKKRKKR